MEIILSCGTQSHKQTSSLFMWISCYSQQALIKIQECTGGLCKHTFILPSDTHLLICTFYQFNYSQKSRSPEKLSSSFLHCRSYRTLLSFWEIISTAIFSERLTFESGVCLLFGLKVKYNFHRNSASLIALCMLHKNME